MRQISGFLQETKARSVDHRRLFIEIAATMSAKVIIPVQLLSLMVDSGLFINTLKQRRYPKKTD